MCYDGCSNSIDFVSDIFSHLFVFLFTYSKYFVSGGPDIAGAGAVRESTALTTDILGTGCHVRVD